MKASASVAMKACGSIKAPKSVMKAMMKAKKGTSSLNKKNLSALGEETKDDKLKRISSMKTIEEKAAALKGFKEDELEADDLLKVFANKEMVKSYNRFSQTGCKKDSEVEDAWKSLQESREPGKERKKRAMLLAWLQHDCTITPKFKTTASSLVISVARTKNLKWLTTKEVLDKHGQEEGLQMIKEGSFMVRKNPQNTKFYQFLAIEEFMTLDVKKQQELKASGTSQVNQQQFHAITSSIKSANLEDMDADVDYGAIGGKTDDLDWNDEEKAMLPCEPVQKAKVVKKTTEDRILEDPDDQKKVMAKVKFMHTTLVKDAQVVQSLMLKAKPTAKASFKPLLKDIKEMIEKFDKHIISESLKFKELKVLLVKSVALHRQVKDLQGSGSDSKSVANKSNV